MYFWRNVKILPDNLNKDSVAVWRMALRFIQRISVHPIPVLFKKALLRKENNNTNVLAFIVLLSSSVTPDTFRK